MKRQLLSNSLLSVVIGALLGVIDLFVFPGLSGVYYVAVVFYWIMYCGQSILLFQTRQKASRFIMFYNLTTVLKMIFSGLFIVIYFFFYQPEADYYFLGYFLILYFLYLLLNVGLFFNNKHETKK